jgi:hypothetical protein
MSKYRSRFILAVLLCTIAFTFVSCNSDNNKNEVTNVTLQVDAATFTGTCPHDFQFSGLIETNVAGTIRYIWERSTGNSATQTVTLPVGGGVIVQDIVHVTASGSVTVTLHVTSPNDKVSNAVTATATCQ